MKSSHLFHLAKKVIPSGVNSPVRAFKAVGGDPVFIRSGKGPFIRSEDGKEYLDFCASWGPLIFGHAPEGLIQEVIQTLKLGTSFGAPTHREVELAQKICKLIPSVEKVRLVSSGTEAVMSAVRLARGFTARKKIVKIDGGYHGHVDSLLVKAGSGAATFGVPDSAGIPAELSKLTYSVPFNDIHALEELFKKEGKEIAAMILEPVPANMGVVLPQLGYLEKVRAVTERYGAVLIFDEVITGFRVNKHGAQHEFGVRPDLTCLGKIAGGGFPLAIFGGRHEIMDCLAPAGPVYQAGTLSGNPIAVTGALWMLGELEKKEAGVSVMEKLNKKSADFFSILDSEIHRLRLPVTLNRIASMFTIFFSRGPVTDYTSAKTSQTGQYGKFFQECLKKGLYLPPAQFEAAFISTSHTDRQLKQAAGVLIKAMEKACKGS